MHPKSGSPELDCGLCGFKTCSQFKDFLINNPNEGSRCVYQKSIRNADFKNKSEWIDALGRYYDFILESRSHDSGPVEVIHPYNPQIIESLQLKEGDIVIGRPLSAGCPITHCGKIIHIDKRSCNIKWSISGLLASRACDNLIDIGDYSVQAFEGIVKETKVELKLGIRYYFLPSRCVLQWRHSGIISFIEKTSEGICVRIEGIYLG